MKTTLLSYNDTATTEIYTLSLHDALPSFAQAAEVLDPELAGEQAQVGKGALLQAGAVKHGRHGCPSFVDRKSTRLNSSHANMSYAVLCLKQITRGLSRVRSAILYN